MKEQKIERIKELNSQALGFYNIDNDDIDEFLEEVDDEATLDEIILAMETLNVSLFQVLSY